MDIQDCFCTEINTLTYFNAYVRKNRSDVDSIMVYNSNNPESSIMLNELANYELNCVIQLNEGNFDIKHEFFYIIPEKAPVPKDRAKLIN